MARAPQTKVVDLSADFRLADPGRLCALVWPRAFCARTAAGAVYGLTEIYRDKIKAARLVANPGCYTSCAELALIPLLEGQGHRSRRDRHRRQVRHDRRGQGGQRGNAVLGSVRGHPCLWRRPSPPHGRARPGILPGRRPRRGRELHAAPGADEPGHPVDDLCPWSRRPRRRIFMRCC